MPRTRATGTRDDKIDEILAHAQRRLRDDGYSALSIAAIARELGVAQNTIYWYFPSKDELFVAAMQRMLAEIVARKPSKKSGEIEQILWFVDQFDSLSDLRGAMGERARSSPAVAEFVRQLDDRLSRMLSNALREQVPPEELSTAVEAFRSTVEGTFVKRLTRAERRRVLSFTLARIIAAAGSG
jgi:AcrR family transcriptional regulator